MEHEPKKVVKVTDRRGRAQEPVREDVGAPQEAPSDAVGSASPSDRSETSDTDPVQAGDTGLNEGVSDISPRGLTGDTEPQAAERDYLDDLKRLQAEFDNYRKRMMRDNGAAGGRAAARVIENLLPVLDNFERAISHGEGGEGVQLVFKDLRAALEREGLEEVPAEGTAFDPNIHEAVESREVEGLAEPRIIEVYRRGYMHKGQLLRPAMVVVGRPIEPDLRGAEE